MNSVIINKDNYFKCDNCGYLSKNEYLNSDEEKARYDMHICDNDYLKYMQKVYKNIQSFLNEGISIDYGCGKVHALSDIMNENGYVCDYYDLYYYNNKISKKYDNIILIEVFEHIKDSFDFFNQIKNYLKENGNVIIMTQLIPKNINNWWYMRDITHISFHTLKSLTILAEKCGFYFKYDINNSIFVFTLI